MNEIESFEALEKGSDEVWQHSSDMLYSCHAWFLCFLGSAIRSEGLLLKRAIDRGLRFGRTGAFVGHSWYPRPRKRPGGAQSRPGGAAGRAVVIHRVEKAGKGMRSVLVARERRRRGQDEATRFRLSKLRVLDARAQPEQMRRS